MGRYVEVGVPVPLGQSFTYALPDGVDAGPGSRVLVEFGRRKVLAIVLARVDTPPVGLEPSRIKSVRALLEREPVLPPELLRFCRELAQYYFAPIGEVLRLAVPAVERERVKKLQAQGMLGLDQGPTKQVGGREVMFVRAVERDGDDPPLRGHAVEILAHVREHGETQVAELQTHWRSPRGPIKRLQQLGLVEVQRRRQPRKPLFDVAVERDTPPRLTDEQQAAVSAIETALRHGEHQRSFLLFGVTGSGKTEVYMRAIAACLETGRGALLLVPEIALTPQVVGRFRARFGDDIAVLHSALPDADRYAMWRRLRAGEVKVAVGARSALFAPVEDLGLIVVDEEHDGSFKQEEGVRYHARDMAMLRAHRAGAAIVLGSATPSLESMALVRAGRLQQLRLRERATRASLPKVEVVDLRRVKGDGPTGHRMLTLPLRRAIEQVLEAGEQAIIFLNRRGFAPAVICHDCGAIAECERCSVALTYHRRAGGRLRCHYCDFEMALPDRCQTCGVGELELEGLGTEKLETAIAETFPRAVVGRLDRDVAGGAKSERILNRMRSGEIDLLVGTQMVTKGHDLPGVTLVGVVNADAALSMPDFRAGERGFQLLVQVAGRAGRHEREGRVLIQTRDPGHPAVKYAVAHDVSGFLQHELRDRHEVGYPPFRRLALIRIDAVDEDVARQTAGRYAARARQHPVVAARKVEVLGPAVAPIARLRRRYRFRVLLRAHERPPLRQVVRALLPLAAEAKKARVAVDIDPVSML